MRSDARTGLRRVPAMAAALAALSAAGCHIVVPPLYKTDVEPAGEGVFTVHDLNVGSGAGEAQTFPIKTAVYHRGRGPAGADPLEFGLYSAVEDENRPAKDTTHYLNFEITLRPGSAQPITVNVPTLAFLMRPSRDSSSVYRFARQVGESSLAADSSGAVRGRFTFELTQVTALPSGDGAPIRLEVEFTAVDDLGLLRRMKLGNGRAVRSLEDSHLRRTARPSEDLDTQPIPELRPSNP